MSDPLIVIRAVHVAATLMLAGALTFGAAVGGPALRRTGDDAAGAVLRAQLLRIAWIAFAVALISGAAWLVVLAAQMSGRAPGDVFSGDVLPTVMLHTTFGHDWIVRLAVAVLLAAALCRISPRRAWPWRWAIAALIAAAFAAALVHAGHAAATPGWRGTFHRAADGLHLIAASAWLGGLLPLALLLAAARRPGLAPTVARDATLRFSTLGVISVGTLMATGVVNAWLLSGSVPALVGTDYGRLLLLKVALFLAMVTIAAVNRLRLTPRLAAAAEKAPSESDALPALIRNSLIEAAFGLAILAIVGALGTTPPGLHAQPTWPFAVRYSGAAFGDPQLRATLTLASWGIGGGILVGALLVSVGAIVRRWRWWLIAAGVAVAVVSVAYFVPTLTVATVEAFPTTYYVSPTNYSASSIVQGADRFATHCAACHGRQGRGDGPAGRFFRIKPSDLTADHVYGHTDGDLYWWIGNGMREVMPPFGAVLDEEARWNLIDFVRANADAARLARAPAKVTNVGFRSPDFSARCPDGSTVTRDSLDGRIGHLIVAGRGAAERVAQLAARSGDLVTVVIPLEDIATGAACRADDRELAAALAMLRGKDMTRDLAEGDGAEFLLDASGELRAAWQPGAKPDWRDAGVLQREIAAIADNPVARRTVGAHH